MRTVSVEAATVGHGAGRPVLREVSVTVRPGQLLAVTGPSGSGKSTLLWTMAGLLRPRMGRVCVDGVEIRDRDHAVAQQVVLVPQDNGLAPVLTAFENLLVVLVAHGMAAVEAERLATEALARLDLSEQHDHLIEELSWGQQQRTAVARGLAVRGHVLLADEVTSELDGVNRQRVLELLRAEAARGAAVVLATHDLEAAAHCDAELCLGEGSARLVR